jgi:hypothetical protein
MKGVRCISAVGQYAPIPVFSELSCFHCKLFVKKEIKSLTLIYLRPERTDMPVGYLVRCGAMRHGIN